MAVTDLTGTTWEFEEPLNTTVPLMFLKDRFSININFISNNTLYTKLTIIGSSTFDTINEIHYEFAGEDYEGELDDTVYSSNTWPNDVYKTITITDGIDKDRSDIIDWLYANATLISGGDMAVVWTDTPLIKKITLPSGNTYFLADREGREKIEQLFETISGGVSFVIAWDGASTPVVANIPAGVVVKYNGTNYTGTLSANSATPGAFYLVKSSTTAGGSSDSYDEYVPVGASGSKAWEKIGDTQMDLSDVVMDITATGDSVAVVTGYTPLTDKVIGENATFTITQPTVTLAANASTGTGRVQVATGISTSTGSASGTAVDFASKDQVTAVTGVSATKTYIKGSASGANTAWNSKDQKTAVTGYPNTTSDTFVKSVTAETNKNLVTTSVADGTTTASTTNTDILQGASVSNEVLTIGACTLDTTTAATGATSTTGTGDAVVTGVTIGSSAAALTGLGSPSTASVIGASSTFTVTQPTVTLATDTTSGTGKVQVATDATASGTDTVIGSAATFSVTDPTISVTVTPSTTYLGATASGANTAWNSKDATTVVTGLGTPSTRNVLKSGATINVTKGDGTQTSISFQPADGGGND